MSSLIVKVTLAVFMLASAQRRVPISTCIRRQLTLQAAPENESLLIYHALSRLSLSLFIFLLSYYLPGTFDCSDRRERKHSNSTECPKFRLSAQSKVIEPVLGKKGLQSRISPICTLSQNGYGACPAVLSPKQCFCRFWISEVSLTDFLVCWRAGRRAGGWRAGGRAAGGRVAAAGGRAAGGGRRAHRLREGEVSHETRLRGFRLVSRTARCGGTSVDFRVAWIGIARTSHQTRFRAFQLVNRKSDPGQVYFFAQSLASTSSASRCTHNVRASVV